MGFDLASMLQDVSNLDTSREQIEYIDISNIDEDPHNFYQLSKVEDLASNIELLGLQQPIRVRDNPDQPGRVIIVSGHRRRAALQLLVDEGKEQYKCRELADREEMDVWTVLAGTVAPDFQDVRLAVKYGLLQEGQGWGMGGVTPPDLVKAMLLPGEIKALSRAIQQLSGYQTITVESVKKN